MFQAVTSLWWQLLFSNDGKLKNLRKLNIINRLNFLEIRTERVGIVLNFFRRQSRNLFPGYFAMVMATGALSLSCWYLGLPVAAEALIYFNLFIYVILLALNIIRLTLNTGEFFADVGDHSKGPGFFTLIAGTEVLGSQLVVIKGLYVWGFIFWSVAF